MGHQKAPPASGRVSAPGLKWRKRSNGRDVPIWVADRAGRASGYPVRYVNLSAFAHDHDALVRRCHRLQTEMRRYLNETPREFDGTFGALIELYLTDPESSYRKLKPGSLHPYTIYSAKLKAHIGAIRINDVDGRDVQKWFKAWAGADDLRSSEAKIPRARAVLSVLKAAVSFGISCRKPGCIEFKAVLGELTFPIAPPRRAAPSAADIEAVRNAAHQRGAPSRALLYALQFETTLRQWDLIGQWVPLSDPRPSAILHGREKWIGPTWGDIDDAMILRVTPTKTERTSGTKVAFDLTLCPMVMAELQSARRGAGADPIVVHEATGRPYRYDSFADCWRADFKAAGIPKGIWNRDIRAGGITEGSKSGARIEDTARVAGHSTPKITARVYDRDDVEAHRRVMGERQEFRKKGGPRTP